MEYPTLPSAAPFPGQGWQTVPAPPGLKSDPLGCGRSSNKSVLKGQTSGCALGECLLQELAVWSRDPAPTAHLGLRWKWGPLRQDCATGKGWCSMQVAFGDCLEVLLSCLGQPSLSPSAECTITLRYKPQTASEVLKKEKTEPNLVPLIWESQENEAGEVLLISHSTGDICSQPQACGEPPPRLS